MPKRCNSNTLVFLALNHRNDPWHVNHVFYTCIVRLSSKRVNYITRYHILGNGHWVTDINSERLFYLYHQKATDILRGLAYIIHVGVFDIIINLNIPFELISGGIGMVEWVRGWRIERIHHKPHNTAVPHPTMHHSEQKCAYFFSTWCIVGYGTGALWDFWDCSNTRRSSSQNYHI